MSDIKNVKKKIQNVYNDFEKQLKSIIDVNSVLLATHTRQSYLQGGTSDTRLQTRTGKLKASTKPLKAKKTPNGIIGGIRFGTLYAGVHIGKKGRITTIRPKNKQYLAIPLKAAKTNAGVARGGPLDEHLFGETFIRKSKAGNLIIFGKQKYQKGAKAGSTHGDIIPLFVLKKQVQVKTRVDVNVLMKWVKPKIINDLKKVKVHG